MSEHLSLRIHDANIEWLLKDETSSIVRLRGHGTADEFKERFESMSWDGDVHVLLPAEAILLTRVTVPTKQIRQVQQAVPYLVEEQIASEVDDCFFALGPRQGSEILVAVLERDYLESVIDLIRSMHLEPTLIVPDLTLVSPDSAPRVMVDGNRAHVRQLDGTGLTVPIDQLLETLSLMDLGGQLQLMVQPDQREQIALILSGIEADGETQVELLDLESEPFEVLCERAPQAVLNLLQGPYEVKKTREGGNRGWLTAAMLAACTFGLYVLLLLGQAVYLDVRANEYTNQAQSLYTEVFPNDRNVRDLRRRWAAHLSRSGQGGEEEFLTLFSQAAVNIPGSSLVLQNVNYNESRGDLILQIVAPRSEQLVAYSESLVQAGLEAEIGTISQDENSVRGSIKVKSFGR